jgi:hypothetical protein
LVWEPRGFMRRWRPLVYWSLLRNQRMTLRCALGS